MKVVSVTDDHALVKLTRLELLILNNSLNEVCNGLHISEFHARIGADRSIVRRLLTVVGATFDTVVVNAKDRKSD